MKHMFAKKKTGKTKKITAKEVNEETRSTATEGRGGRPRRRRGRGAAEPLARPRAGFNSRRNGWAVRRRRTPVGVGLALANGVLVSVNTHTHTHTQHTHANISRA